jgi:glycosyltransferase involved in cell wall biosynthesis
MVDVSVVIPTHNRSELLKTTLRSVLGQRDVNIEVIVVDDGSTDDTREVVAAIGDDRIQMVGHETPQGVSAARNRGVTEATGEWIAFIDDDDLWAPDKLPRQLEAARRTNKTWVYSGVVNVNDRLRVVSGAPPPSPDRMVELLPHYNAMPGGGSNVAVRKDTLTAAGPFDSRLHNTEDWEMWLRLASRYPPAWVAEPLLAYRVHTANASLNIGEILAGAALIERVHDTQVDWARIYRWIAESCLRTGRRKDALRYFGKAALRGGGRIVAKDLHTIAFRRVKRGLHLREDTQAHRHPEWIARADIWLDEFVQPARQ